MWDRALIENKEGGIARLLEIMRALRDPQRGCPWDIEQDFASIAPYTIEEAYEVADAISRENWDDLREELGDLLLQTVYHAQIGQERGLFDFNAIANAISDKMVARHPHVFGPERREKTAAQQTQDWEKIKADERQAKAKTGVLDDVALGLPALSRALKLQKRMARVGFDWNDVADVFAKIDEEWAELNEAKQSGDLDKLEDEFGDLLFVMANLARHWSIDPEAALRRTNDKVTRRFRYIEKKLAEQNRQPEQIELDALEALWQEAKAEERQ